MNIQSLQDYKKLRKSAGTWNSIIITLSSSGVQRESVDHFLDGICCDIGHRRLEKLKTIHVYDMMVGFLTFCEEHMLLVAHQT